MRFVVVCLLFLGWTFYELSGGTDFVPRGIRPAKPEPQVAQAGTGPAVARPAPATALVARPAIAPRQPAGPGWLAGANQARDLDAMKREAAERARERRTSLAAGLAMFPAADPGAEVSLASAEGSVASLGDIVARPATPAPVAIAARPEPEPDIREVTGTRVNMRDGPGTIYPVIQRLAIGQTVEVLGESGTGWLRLRIVEGQQVGWVSASLIGKPAD